MKIFRKRYIPNEVVDISGDEVVFQNDEMVVTKWLPIHPRNDIARGISYTLLKKGWKISKFFDKEDNLIYWYCDIIDVNFEDDTLYVTDLLVDIKVYAGNKYEILDCEELEEAVRDNLITESQKEEAIEKLNKLVKVIEDGEFPPFDEIK